MKADPMDRYECARALKAPAEAVRIARLLNRDVVRYEANGSGRAYRLAAECRREREFFMGIARGLKAQLTEAGAILDADAARFPNL